MAHQHDETNPYPQPMYAWRAQYLAQRQYIILPFLSAIQVPTLALAGEQDRLVHVEDAKLLVDHIHHASL